MTILALDLADCAGWATRSGPEILSGILDLSIAEGQHPGARSLRARGALRSLAEKHKSTVVAWERIVPAQAKFRGSNATASLYGLQTQLVEVIYTLGLVAVTVAPSTLKKFATGSGKADKARMVLEARRKWPGWTPATHDEADARWVLAWAEHALGYEQGLDVRKVAAGLEEFATEGAAT